MATNEELLPKTKSLTHTLRLSLNELYTGTTRTLFINNNRVCDECVGTGAISGRSLSKDDCEQCHSLGLKTIITRVAPDVQQRIVRVCYVCWGKRITTVPQNRCTSCSGEGVVGNPSAIIVKVKRGSRDGQKIIYKEEGTQMPNMRPGDVVVILEEKDHPIFTRDGDDLHMKMNVAFVEALCGFERYVETLDKRRLRLKCPGGMIIQPNIKKCVPGEGMPNFENPTEKGDLIIQFEVNIPDQIRTRHIKSLEQCLPPGEVPEIPIDAKECNLVDFSHPLPGKAYLFTPESGWVPDRNYDPSDLTDQYYRHEQYEPYEQHGQNNHHDHQYGDEQNNHQGEYYHVDNNDFIQRNN